MGRPISWDSIPDQQVFPEGAYTCEIADISEVTSGSGKRMYKAELRVLEPPTFANMPIFENFVFGSDEDPNADDPETEKKSIGARRMKSMFKAAQVQLTNDMEETLENAKGCQLTVLLSQTKEPDMKAGQPNQYAGQVRNKINAFHQIGTVETNVASNGPTRSAAAGPRPAPKPAAPKAPAPAVKTPATTKSSAPKVHCSICGQDVPRAEFGKHSEAHMAEEE